MNPETEQLEEVQDRPVFTATTRLNAAMQQEAATALTPKATTVVSWICFGVIALMAGVLVWQLIATGNKNNLFMLVVLALTMVFLLYNKFTAPKKALQRWEAGIRRQYGTDCLTLETEFYPHNLAQTLKENDDITVEGYSTLSRIAETEHLLLLRRSRDNWFFVEKSGIGGGTVDDLVKFLEARGLSRS